MEITLQLCCVLVSQFTVYFSTSELCYKCFSYNGIFFMTLGLHFLWYACITDGNNITIKFHLFVIVTYFYYVTVTSFICLMFLHVFYGVRITLYFGTFELCMEITLQLRFVLFLIMTYFLITSQLRYLFVQCSYIF